MIQFAGRSLTTRLTLLFASVSMAVLLLLGLLVGILVERHFVEMDLVLLQGKLELVRHAFAQAPSPAAGGDLGQRLDAALVGHHDLAVEVRRGDGRLLYSSRDAAVPPRLLAPGGDGDEALGWQAADGRRYRGIGGVVSPAIAGDAGVMVAVAIDLGHHEHFMRSFRRALWSVVALAALLSGFLGWMVARRGLAPLRDICSVAASITANRLDQRLTVAAIPQELAEVVQTLNDMLSRLEESFRRLANFSSDLAHELRTPVSNLLTQTQVTLARARSADEYQDVLGVERRGTTSDCRAWSPTCCFIARADEGSAWCRIAGAAAIWRRLKLASLVEFHEALAAEEKGVVLCRRGRSARSSVAIRLMLRRAIGNLLSNAIRHTPAGGRVRVRRDDAAAGDRERSPSTWPTRGPDAGRRTPAAPVRPLLARRPLPLANRNARRHGQAHPGRHRGGAGIDSRQDVPVFRPVAAGGGDRRPSARGQGPCDAEPGPPQRRTREPGDAQATGGGGCRGADSNPGNRRDPREVDGRR
jgi:two-component system heavy metal sensor histidine kinase CusS